jgi:hypothetical protein
MLTFTNSNGVPALLVFIKVVNIQDCSYVIYIGGSLENMYMSHFTFVLPFLQIEDSPRQGAEFMSKVARLMVKLQL